MFENMPTWLNTGISGAVGALGTLTFGFLIHIREMRKISDNGIKVTAEAEKVEAEAMDLHWDRFQREIKRLVERVEVLEDEVRRCHRDREKTETQLTQLKLALIQQGNQLPKIPGVPHGRRSTDQSTN